MFAADDFVALLSHLAAEFCVSDGSGKEELAKYRRMDR